MTKDDVFQLLADHANDKGIANWARNDTSGLETYGIGLTVHRKLAKAIGRDADLAAELWETNNYDARVISLLIDDPKTFTREKAERQVEQLAGGYLAHVFSACGATLGKTDFVRDLADEWIASDDAVRKDCGYGLIYEMSKSKKKSAPDADYFLA